MTAWAQRYRASLTFLITLVLASSLFVSSNRVASAAQVDGGFFVFMSARECPPHGQWCSWKIYRKEAGGETTDLSGLNNTDFAPSLSPDGSQITFASYPTNGSQIFLMNSDGTGRLQLSGLTSDEQVWDEYAAWSPDGESILFTRWTFTATQEWSNGQIWILRRNAMGLWEESLFFDRRGSEVGAKFSPDGTKVAYAYHPDTDRVSDENDINLKDLWIFDLATKKHRRLTNTPGYSEETPEWSPNGRRIVFSRGREPEPDLGAYPVQLRTIAADGSDNRELLGGRNRVYMLPEWTAKPSTITFQNCPRPGVATYFYDLDCGVATMDMQSRQVTEIEDTPGFFDGQPDWSH